MNRESELEKIYDLLETFSFDELKPEEQEIVLKHMTKSEYDSMRATILDSRHFFSSVEADEKVNKPSVIKRIAYMRIEFYKVAAAILVLLIAGITILAINPRHTQTLLASTDTIYIKQTDTVVIKVTDTVEKIVEQPVYRFTKVSTRHEGSLKNKITKTAIQKTDCSVEMCPEDLQRFTDIKNNNSISKDKELTDFLVSIQ
jgi:hypothetical protein